MQLDSEKTPLTAHVTCTLGAFVPVCSSQFLRFKLSHTLPLLTLAWILMINLFHILFCETVCRYFKTVPFTLMRNYTEIFKCTFLYGYIFFPPVLIADSLPNVTLTKSFSTKKEERSTKTHVGIMKNTAWHPSMFSNRRWCIRESLNTLGNTPCNQQRFSSHVMVTTSDRYTMNKY